MCVENCPVHSRTSVNNPIQANTPVEKIDYIGKYAVVTIDNPDFLSPLTAIKAAMGLLDKMPPMFVTLVVEVGENGALGDVMEAGPGGLETASRFRESHTNLPDGYEAQFDSYEAFSVAADAELERMVNDAHTMIKSSVENGLIPSV